MKLFKREKKEVYKTPSWRVNISVEPRYVDRLKKAAEEAGMRPTKYVYEVLIRDLELKDIRSTVRAVEDVDNQPTIDVSVLRDIDLQDTFKMPPSLLDEGARNGN